MTEQSQAQNASGPITAEQIVARALDQIVQIFEGESILSGKLRELAQQTQSHILVDDYNALLNTSQEQEALSQQLRQWEHHRVQLTRQLDPFIPNISRLRLSEWPEHIPEPFASQLAEFCETFKRETAQLQKLNRQNAALIQRSLRFAETALGIEAATYGAKTEYVTSSPQLMDRTL